MTGCLTPTELTEDPDAAANAPNQAMKPVPIHIVSETGAHTYRQVPIHIVSETGAHTYS